jgi:hypothetical protein
MSRAVVGDRGDDRSGVAAAVYHALSPRVTRVVFDQVADLVGRSIGADPTDKPGW